MSNRSFLRMNLALIGLISAQVSATETTSSMVNVFHPTTNCELIKAVVDANNAAGQSIIDLGGRVFELTLPCDEQALPANCPAFPPPAPTECFADNLAYAHGPSGLPEITNSISIVNGRILRAAVVGDGVVPDFRLITVTTDGGDLTLFKVTIENGHAAFTPANKVADDDGSGGGLFVDDDSSLSLNNSKVGFNLADDSGGGIYVAPGGSLDIQMSLITNNHASNTNGANLKAGGGGIYLDNDGELFASLLRLDSSTVSHNTTPGLGAGLHNQGIADNIVDSTFSYNLACESAPGSGECEPGFNPSGNGGGIYNDSTATLLLITQSTFWGNRALSGGAIYNEEATVLVPVAPPAPPYAKTSGVFMNNNSIANNYAQLNGGGIYNTGTINQFVSNLVGKNVDFDANNAPDIFNSATGTITVVLLPADPILYQIVEGFNFVGDCGTADQCGLSNDVNKDIVGGSANSGLNIDPRIHDLENNGGPTETVALIPDSPAVNNGYNNLSLSYDQRGPNFFRTVAQTDIGSFEYQYDI